MKRAAIVTISSIVLLAGCISSAPVQTTFDRPYPAQNRAGDPIVAVFVGRIPCTVNDCEMRKVEIVLYGREQGRIPTTYWMGQIGVGSGNDRVVEEGTWSGRRGVQDYPGATVYALDRPADPSLQYFWRVNDEVLLVLDQSMRPRSGNAAWGYMLSRDCAPYGPRHYPYDKRTKRFIAVPGDSTCSDRLTPSAQT
jgi:hypothetical protein